MSQFEYTRKIGREPVQSKGAHTRLLQRSKFGAKIKRNPPDSERGVLWNKLHKARLSLFAFHINSQKMKKTR